MFQKGNQLGQLRIKTVVVKTQDGQTFAVEKGDLRLKSGELVHVNVGRKRPDASKRMRERKPLRGIDNPMFGKHLSPESIALSVRTKFLGWLKNQGTNEGLYLLNQASGNWWCSGHKAFHPLETFFNETANKRQPTQCKLWVANSRFHREFGVPLDWYETKLAEQDGGCAVCGRKDNPVRGKSALFAGDHNHETNELRGLLCHNCNSYVGWLENHGQAASNYLQQYKKSGVALV